MAKRTIFRGEELVRQLRAHRGAVYVTAEARLHNVRVKAYRSDLLRTIAGEDHGMEGYVHGGQFIVGRDTGE